MEETPYFITSFFDGKTLHERQNENTNDIYRSFSIQEALDIIEQLSLAIEEVHKIGYLFLILKPTNILIDAANNVKLIHLFQSIELKHQDTNKIDGYTPGYSPPELHIDPLFLTKAADVYSLGGLLYELVTGVLPMNATLIPSQITQCSTEIDKIIATAMNINPKERYQDATQFRKAILQLRGIEMKKSNLDRVCRKIPYCTTFSIVVILVCAFYIQSKKENTNAPLQPTTDISEEKNTDGKGNFKDVEIGEIDEKEENQIAEKVVLNEDLPDNVYIPHLETTVTLPTLTQMVTTSMIWENNDGDAFRANIKSIFCDQVEFILLDGNEKKIPLKDLNLKSHEQAKMWALWSPKRMPYTQYREWTFNNKTIVGNLKSIMGNYALITKEDNSDVLIALHELDKLSITYVNKYRWNGEIKDNTLTPEELNNATYKKVSKMGFKSISLHDEKNDYFTSMGAQLHIPEILSEMRPDSLPLIVFLHGLDEAGTDNIKQFKYPSSLFYVNKDQRSYIPCFYLSPQHHVNGHWMSYDIGQPDESLEAAVEMILMLINHFPSIDRRRIYVMGLSSGGAGALSAVAEWPEIFAAGVSMSESLNYKYFNQSNARPLWMFYNKNSTYKGIMYDAHKIQENFKKFKVECNITEYDSKYHNVWDQAFGDKKLHEWIQKQKQPSLIQE